MRVYLPSTLPALTAALKAGEIGPAPIAGFAVTPALREGYASGDLEELEYVALLEAARAALRLLAGDPTRPRAASSWSPRSPATTSAAPASTRPPCRS